MSRRACVKPHVPSTSIYGEGKDEHVNLGRFGLIAAAIAAPVMAPVAVAFAQAIGDAPDAHPADGNAAEAPNGVTETFSSHLPGSVRYAVADTRMVIGKIVQNIANLAGQAPTVTTHSTNPVDQARASWVALEHSMGYRGDQGMYSEYSDAPLHVATVWPLGQVLAGALDIAKITGDYHDVNAVTSRLSEFDRDGAYAQGVYSATAVGRLYDDNDWIALDLIQAYQQTGNQQYLDKAKQIATFLEQGVSPEGGVYWGENESSLTINTCSSAPTEQVMLRLYELTHDEHYLDVAKKIEPYRATNLRTADGLYVDNINAKTGQVDEHHYSYNQGTPIGADVLWYKTTGDAKYLERAKETAKAALNFYGKSDRLWHEAPAFNAIFFRNLMQLDAVAPDPRIKATLTAYLDRARREALNPATGLYTEGGIGHYGDTNEMSVIDQAAFVQMQALLGWKSADIPQVS